MKSRQAKPCWSGTKEKVWRIPKSLARHAFNKPRSGAGLSVTAEAREQWQRFLEEARRVKEKLDVRINEDWWYRGQRSRFELEPSLFRLLKQGFNSRERDPRSILEIEYNLFFEFACRGPGMQDPGFSSWDKLAYMRHHGLPTRLLDWTERLGVAVFFALRGVRSDSPEPVAIWILNPYRLNEITIKDRDLCSPRYLGLGWKDKKEWDYEDYLIYGKGHFDWKGPVAIYPPQKNPRMRSQHGWFTLFGEDFRPLEKQCPKVVQKLEIPSTAIPAAREFLIEAGIDEGTIFPDLDGFSAYLKEYYRIP